MFLTTVAPGYFSWMAAATLKLYNSVKLTLIIKLLVFSLVVAGVPLVLAAVFAAFNNNSCAHVVGHFFIYLKIMMKIPAINSY